MTNTGWTRKTGPKEWGAGGWLECAERESSSSESSSESNNSSESESDSDSDIALKVFQDKKMLKKLLEAVAKNSKKKKSKKQNIGLFDDL